MISFFLRSCGFLAVGLASYAALHPTPAASPKPAEVRITGPAAAKPDVVAAANAFLAMLTADQRQAVVVGFNAANVTKWSNFPCGLNCRQGLLLKSLTPAQQAAALAVVRAATGTVANDGFDEIEQLRAADDNLSTAPAGSGRRPGGPPGARPGGLLPGPPPGGSARPFGGPGGGGGGYGSDIYAIAFLGKPSATGTWMLQFGGHHLATNITFDKGAVTGATPKFEGVEPLTFTTTSANVFPTGTACAPLSNEASAMLALINGLTPTQKAQAKLTQTFGDVLVGPGQDGHFPATKVGLPGSALTAGQRALLLAAMKPWVQDADDATAASLLADYQRGLPNTCLAFSGTGTLTTSGDYVRIDGPNVWIEFVCQGGAVYHGQIHYHSIWRDRTRDYGGNFYTTRQGR